MAALKYRLIVLIVICSAAFHPAFTCAEEEIVVGATISLEGRFKAPSRMVQSAYRLWEKEINDAGGLLGRPVRLLLYDDKSKIDLVRHYYEKMIVEDNVDLVLAPYGTTLSYEASAISERHGYVMITSTASGEMIWNRGFQYVFGVYGMADRYFIGFLDIVARQGLRSVAIFSEDTLFTRDAAEGARIWAERMGLTVTFQQTYAQAADSISLMVSQLEGSKPDAVILCSYPPDGYQFLSALAASNYKPKALAMTVTPVLPDFAQNAGAMADGVFSPSQWEPDERIPFPGSQRFIQDFELFAGVGPSYHACAAYTGCQLMADSIIAHGEIDQDKIRDHILTLDTVTVIGRFKVDDQGRQVGHNSLIVQWQNNRKEIVYPKKMRTSQARFNNP